MAKKRGQTSKGKNSKTTSKNVNNKPKKAQSKKKKFFKGFFATFIVIMLIGLAAALMYAFSIWSTLSDVSADNFYVSNMTIDVYDRNDDVLDSSSLVDYVKLYDDNGELNVNPYYIKGIIDTEDSKFEKHNGVDFIGLIKGFVQTVFTDTSRGASTVTMQLAKLVYMQDWEVYNEEGYNEKYLHPIEYKVTQMLYAIKVEQNFTKEEIMENYINSVYFGDGAGYGIGNASQYYYGKEPKDLTLPEAALLAGIPQSPNNYDPYVNIDSATERRNVVLGRLYELGDITEAEYNDAVATNIEDTLVEQGSEEQSDYIKNMDYLDLVYRELYNQFGETEDFNLFTSGIDVYTNLDPEIQEITYDTLSTDEYVTMEQDDLQAGTVTVDSQTGAVLAVGGGRDDQDLFATNYAFTEYRQPGSTAKPIIDYGPALEFLDWSTHHLVVDEETTYDDGPEVNNWDDDYEGEMTLQEALAQSRNTTALATFKAVSDEIGVKGIIEFLEGLGITDLDVNQAYSIGGWDTGTTPLEMAGAYAAFANGGIYHKPTTIRYVEIAQNSPLYEEYGDRYDFMDKGERAMSEETAYMMAKMLDPTNGDADGIGATAASGIDNESIKTGTTNWPSGNSAGHDTSEIRDKWVVGYTPDVTTAVWTGFDYEGEKTQSLTATNHDSYYIYQSIMSVIGDSASEYLSDDKLSKPSTVEAVKLENDTWPPVEDSKGNTYYFIKGSDDYDEIEKTDDNLERPSIRGVKVSGSNVDINWSNGVIGGKYIVTIDGKDYKTVTKKKISIPLSDFASFA